MLTKSGWIDLRQPLNSAASWIMNIWGAGLQDAWSPSELFGELDVGAWYDPSDLTSLVQDRNTSNPVVWGAVDQPVAMMLDKRYMGSKTAAQFIASQPNLVPPLSNQAAWEFTGNQDYTWNGDGSVTIRDGTGMRPVDNVPQDVDAWTYGKVTLTENTGVSQDNVLCTISTSVNDLRLGDEGIGTHETVEFGTNRLQPSIFANAGQTVTVTEFEVKALPGYHMYVTASDDARPTLRQTVGGLYYLDPDGIDDYMLTYHLTASGYAPDLMVDYTHVGAWTSATSGRFMYCVSNVLSDALRISANDAMVYLDAGLTNGEFTVGATRVATFDINYGGTSTSRVDGAASGSSATDAVTSATKGFGLFIRQTNIVAGLGDHSFYGGLWIDRDLTTDEAKLAEAFFAERSGVTLINALTGADIATGEPTLDQGALSTFSDLTGADIATGAPIVEATLLGAPHGAIAQRDGSFVVDRSGDYVIVRVVGGVPVDAILDEAGDPLLDEAGDYLTLD